MGKRATSTIEVEIFQIEGFDVRFVGGDPGSGPYVDPYPYERAANSTWTVKKWRTSRWGPTYPDYDVEVLDAGGTPVHGKSLLSTVRATYEDGIEPEEGRVGATAAVPPADTANTSRGEAAGTKVNPLAAIATGDATDIYDIADRLWDTADELRANSALKASEYSVPVLGLIFLKFADSRFTQAESELEGSGSSRRTITKANYHARGVLYLPPAARFASLLKLTEGDNLGRAINTPWESSRTRTPPSKVYSLGHTSRSPTTPSSACSVR